jgi:hypothetical protein
VALFSKFDSFSQELANGGHNLGSDLLMIALTSVPPVDTDEVLADLTEIAYTNLLNNPTSREVVTVSSFQSAGNYKLILDDVTLEASGGPMVEFQYVVLYNDTSVGKMLIGYYDYGAGLTIAESETLLIDFDGVNGVLQLNWV